MKRNDLYAKILVGTNKGLTLFVSAQFHDENDTILVKYNRSHWEYQTGEYELFSMTGKSI